ncbi:hypothetical protein C8Q79DRAFT_736991 [Trametes meyenii]|nr:hypothetical protein C8Q79DRAFT_736991 [Trametes meyenii]
MRPSNRADDVQDAAAQAATRQTRTCARAGMRGTEEPPTPPPYRASRACIPYVAFTERFPDSRVTRPRILSPDMHEIACDRAISRTYPDELYDDTVRPAKQGIRVAGRARFKTLEDTSDVGGCHGQPGTPSAAVPGPLGPPVVQRPQRRGHMRIDLSWARTPSVALRTYVGTSHSSRGHNATYGMDQRLSGLSGCVTVCQRWYMIPDRRRSVCRASFGGSYRGFFLRRQTMNVSN